MNGEGYFNLSERTGNDSSAKLPVDIDSALQAKLDTHRSHAMIANLQIRFLLLKVG